MQYDLTIKHKPGILNKADALFRRPDYSSQQNKEEETAFPLSIFINKVSLTNILPAVINEQMENPDYLNELADNFPLIRKDDIWFHNNQIVVVENNSL
jgi:hypothetical protein